MTCNVEVVLLYGPLVHILWIALWIYYLLDRNMGSQTRRYNLSTYEVFRRFSHQQKLRKQNEMLTGTVLGQEE